MPLSRENITNVFVGEGPKARIFGFTPLTRTKTIKDTDGKDLNQFVVVDPAGTAFDPGATGPMTGGGLSGVMYNAIYDRGKDGQDKKTYDNDGRPTKTITTGEATYNDSLAKKGIDIIHTIGPVYRKGGEVKFEEDLTRSLQNTIAEWQKNPKIKNKPLSLPLISAELFHGKDIPNNGYYDIYLRALDKAMEGLGDKSKLVFVTPFEGNSKKDSKGKDIVNTDGQGDLAQLGEAMTRLEATRSRATGKPQPTSGKPQPIPKPAKPALATPTTPSTTTITPSTESEQQTLQPSEAEKQKAITELKGKTDVVANMGRMQDAAYNSIMKIDPKRKDIANEAFGLINDLKYETSPTGGSLTGFTDLRAYLGREDVVSLANADKSFGIFHNLISTSATPSASRSDVNDLAKASVEHFGFLKADPIETSGKQDVTNLGDALKNLAADKAVASNPTFSASVSASSQQLYEELSSKALELAKAELAKAEAEAAKAGGVAPGETTKPKASGKKDVSQETRDRVELAKQTVIGLTTITAMGIASAFFPPVGVLLVVGVAAYLMNRKNGKDKGPDKVEEDELSPEEKRENDLSAKNFEPEARARAASMKSRIDAELAKQPEGLGGKNGDVKPPAANSNNALEVVTAAATTVLEEVKTDLEKAKQNLSNPQVPLPEVSQAASPPAPEPISPIPNNGHNTSNMTPASGIYDNLITSSGNANGIDTNDRKYPAIENLYESVDDLSVSNPIYGFTNPPTGSPAPNDNNYISLDNGAPIYAIASASGASVNIYGVSGDSVVDDDKNSPTEATYLTIDEVTSALPLGKQLGRNSVYDTAAPQIKIVTGNARTDAGASSVTDGPEHTYDNGKFPQGDFSKKVLERQNSGRKGVGGRGGDPADSSRT